MNHLIVDLYSHFSKQKDRIAFIQNNIQTSYSDFLSSIQEAKNKLDHQIPDGAYVILYGDFDASSISLFFALAEKNCLIAPLQKQYLELKSTTALPPADYIIKSDLTEIKTIQNPANKTSSQYFDQLRKQKKAGLILLTSGTSGEPKVAIHDLTRFFEFPNKAKTPMITLSFLLFDHLGGIHTMLQTLKSGGTLVYTKHRTPNEVCTLIKTHNIELLPTTPTFLRLFYFLARKYSSDLKSLKLITYGTEPMSEFLLNQIGKILPWVKFKQTYGLTETGIIPSISKSSQTTWMKIGSENNEIRIRNNLIEIKNTNSILGYLNHPSPFTEDGWYQTHDVVEMSGDWIRIIAKKTSLINVGGLKVDPISVLNVLYQIEDVLEAYVYGESHALLGQIVVAEVSLQTKISHEEARQKIRDFCSKNLHPQQVPQKIIITSGSLHNERFKSSRDSSCL